MKPLNLKPKKLQKVASVATAAALAFTLAACSPSADESSPQDIFTNTDTTTLPAAKDKKPTGDSSGKPVREEEVIEIAPEDTKVDDKAYGEQNPFNQEGVKFFGITPSEVKIPEVLKDSFAEEELNTLAESALRFIYKGFANDTLLRERFDEVDTPQMIMSYYDADLDKEGKSVLKERLFDHDEIWKVFAVLPFMSNVGAMEVSGDTTRYIIDDSKPPTGYLNGFTVMNTTYKDSGEEYAVVQYTMNVHQPILDSQKVIEHRYGIALQMTPRPDGEGWLVSNWATDAAPSALVGGK